jgi:uncharacterized protein YkwD
MMSNPWDIDDPFAFRCDVCGQESCLGHSDRRKANPVAIVVAIVLVVALVAGSFGFLLGARGSQESANEFPSGSSSDGSTSTTIGSNSTTDSEERVFQPIGEEKLMLDSVNAERARESLDALTWCPALARSATDHSQDMALKNYFEHESLDGREVADRAKSQGYDFQTVGENIAVGQRDVAEVMQGWMNSPGHRENILRPQFTHLGSGVAIGDFKGQRSIYWTQNFGAGGNCQ